MCDPTAIGLAVVAVAIAAIDLVQGRRPWSHVLHEIGQPTPATPAGVNPDATHVVTLEIAGLSLRAAPAPHLLEHPVDTLALHIDISHLEPHSPRLLCGRCRRTMR